MEHEQGEAVRAVHGNVHRGQVMTGLCVSAHRNRGEGQVKQGERFTKLCFSGKLFWQQFGVVDIVLEKVKRLRIR